MLLLKHFGINLRFHAIEQVACKHYFSLSYLLQC